MEKNKDMILEIIDQAKYDEEITILKDMVRQEEEKGSFQVMGDIDRRKEELKDVDMHQGFQTNCGIRGGKLSGG